MKKAYLIPKPQNLFLSDDIFDFKCVNLNCKGCDDRVIKAATELCNTYSTGKTSGGKLNIEHNNTESEEYSLNILPDKIDIKAESAAGAFYAVQTLKQLLMQGTDIQCMLIEDKPDFVYRGFYHDITRGRIPTLDSLKKLAEDMAFYKLNSLQLYVEHTFAFKEYSDLCVGQEPLTAEEIRELDEFCKERFIDLVPSLSTFGHLYTLLQSEKYKHLCELEDYVPKNHLWAERMMHHTLDVSNPESFELIKSLLDQYIPLFHSKYFNICCDETFDLTCGRNIGRDKGELYMDFVSKIISYVESKGKTAMLWGEIVLQHFERLSEMSEKAILLDWDYTSNPDENNIKKFYESGRKQFVCPGTSGWMRLVEYLPESIPNIKAMASYGKKYKAIGLLNTNWGDYGHLCNPLNAAYGRILGAAESWNVGSADVDFEPAISLLHYNNTNGKAVENIHILNECDNINVFMQLFDFYDSVKKSSEFKRADYTAEDLIEKAGRCRKASDEYKQMLEKNQVEQNSGKSLLSAADGLNVLLRMLAIVYGNKNDLLFETDFENWFNSFVSQWKCDNKADELPVVIDYFNDLRKMIGDLI